MRGAQVMGQQGWVELRSLWMHKNTSAWRVGASAGCGMSVMDKEGLGRVAILDGIVLSFGKWRRLCERIFGAQVMGEWSTMKS